MSSTQGFTANNYLSYWVLTLKLTQNFIFFMSRKKNNPFSNEMNCIYIYIYIFYCNAFSFPIRINLLRDGVRNFCLGGPNCSTKYLSRQPSYTYIYIYIYIYTHTFFYYIYTHIYTLFYLISYIYTLTQKRKRKKNLVFQSKLCLMTIFIK